MRKLLTIAACLCLGSFYGYGQEKMVSGQVVDSSGGQPVPGVSVSVQGSTIGTATDLYGNYIISVPGDYSALVFRFLGLTPVHTLVGDRSVIHLSMSASLR